MAQDQRDVRIKKLDKLKEEFGIDPFGERFPQTTPIKQTIENFQENKEVWAAGRIMALRKHGRAGFADIRDWTGKIQIYFKDDKTDTTSFKLYQEIIDIGDIIAVRGPLFKTKTGEITILCKQMKFLTKCIRPLPEKWHGLTDPDLRHRRRYLDLIMNKHTLETFLTRSKMIKTIRHFLDQKGFIEVETPMMQPIPGGASAKPFITYHNALDMNLYLRIAPELYLKRLLVGGFEKVYEINRNFRNEGIDAKHNPEFTMLELYQAYANYNVMMDITEELILHLVKQLTGKSKITYAQKEIDFARPWTKVPYKALLTKYAGLEFYDFDKAKKIALELNIPTESKPDTKIANDVFEKTVIPNLQNPTFIIEFPFELCPLAKRKKDDQSVCERFELVIAGMEIANSFTELNDPFDQRQRFIKQLQDREEGMERIDEDFLLALEYGMPPAGGLGIGIDRLLMILTSNTSVKEVILFPAHREVKIEHEEL